MMNNQASTVGKMKRIAIITGITVGIILAGSYGVFKILENANKYEEKQAALEGGMSSEESEQTLKIDGVRENTGLDYNSSEDKVISAMHKMTHQKVKSDDKWGAIQMTPETIDEVKSVLNALDSENTDTLMTILDKWEQGNFDTIVEDHNTLWEMQNGTIGRAYGKLNEEEERIFIENNFK